MHRWRRRPSTAFLLRVVAAGGPFLVGVATSLGGLALLPPPTSGAERVAGWVVVTLVGLGVVLALRRAATRLLPLQALYRLDLAFPDAIPSRFKLARRINAQRTLEERVAHVHDSHLEDAGAAAAAILELLFAMGAHDSRTRGHSERTRVYVDVLAAELDLSAADRDRLRWAALLHDVGKLSVSPALLNKPGAPDPEEWADLKAHPHIGHQLLGPLADWLGPWADGVLQHHERWDGTGYPAGLAGEEISLAARIISVCDAFEVMTAPRSYKPAKTRAAALAELRTMAGAQFDPRMVRAFMGIPVRRMRAGAAGVVSGTTARAAVEVDWRRLFEPIATLVSHLPSGKALAATTGVFALSVIGAAPAPGSAPVEPDRPSVSSPAGEDRSTSLLDRLDEDDEERPHPILFPTTYPRSRQVDRADRVAPSPADLRGPLPTEPQPTTEGATATETADVEAEVGAGEVRGGHASGSAVHRPGSPGTAPRVPPRRLPSLPRPPATPPVLPALPPPVSPAPAADVVDAARGALPPPSPLPPVPVPLSVAHAEQALPLPSEADPET